MSLTVRGPGLSSAGLRTSYASFERSLSRMSSGMRITRAADDAAGLAISEGLRSQVNGSAIAARNVQDGIGMLQTAEGGMAAITSMLQRARDLAVQAANTGAMSAEARAAAADEVRHLVSEIDRTARSTSFNGQRMLDGSRPSAYSFQVGAGAGDRMGVQGYTVTAHSLRLSGTLGAGAGTPTSAGAAAASPSPITTTTTTYLARTAPLTSYTSDRGHREFSFAIGDDPARSFKIKPGETYTASTINALRLELQKGLDQQLPPIPVTVSVDNDGSGPFLTFSVTGSLTTSLTVSGSGATALGGVTTESTTTTTTTQPSASEPPSTTQNALWEVAALADLVASGSAEAITVCDEALATVIRARAEVGASQNRMEHRLSILAVTGENLAAARSRIADADMAQEYSALVRAQVLSQAGTAMQAQGAQRGQRVLQLLTAL